MSEVTLDNWVVYVHPFVNGGDVDMGLAKVRLAGDVTGHPKLGDGPITTSPVKRWIGNTVQTCNTRYTLKDFAGRSGLVGSLELMTSEERARWFDDEDPVEELPSDVQKLLDDFVVVAVTDAEVVE